MPIHVAFTPDEAAPAEIGIVVDVLRATSTIAQALASGYRRVLCCGELDEARALRSQIPNSLVGGERNAVRIEDFDVGASPREFVEARAETLILSTTNGTRAIIETARQCEQGLGLERSDAAVAAALVADAFPTALDGLNARTYGPPGLEEDIAFCAREDVLDVVPRLVGMRGVAAEIRTGRPTLTS